MKKVITYGTYDMLHYGHERLLKRAKLLGDYLIVAITSDDFDITRGKINVQQTLGERIEAIRATGIADKIIIEEYEGQKIDDIRKYGVDIFAIGSDWKGKFDYLNKYCDVVYLERTEGISSSELRTKDRKIRIGFVCDKEIKIFEKYYNECKYVNGAVIGGICTTNDIIRLNYSDKVSVLTDCYEVLLENCDAVYIVSDPSLHYDQIKIALEKEKHVLCEAPISLLEMQTEELFDLANSKNVVLMDAIKTAYGVAYNRLLLLLKGDRIGKIVSIDVTCTSMEKKDRNEFSWNSMCAWGPTAILPIFQILGINYKDIRISSFFSDINTKFDIFSKIDFYYSNAVASCKIGRGAKSEGELIISGTEGYIYVPAPWWKMDYFELRFEDPMKNKRYFYQLDGEGIRYELVAFLKSINTGKKNQYIEREITKSISKVIEAFYNGEKVYSM